ncbi:MAG: nucleoside-triphosphatase [Clostridiales Family XIII bacterium]|nr:nucleoside-triphosphatase [Clostridiales Family XIII bacterium]
MGGDKIFLTGEVRVGKTTIIERFVSDAGIAPRGFRTVIGRVASDGGADCVFLVPYGTPPDAYEDYPPVAERDKRRFRVTPFPQVFDTLGVRVLRESFGAAFIVMDELGFMESDALAFRAEVMRHLDGAAPILGVVKPRRTAFLDEIRAHASVEVIEVTEGNRDALPGILARRFDLGSPT